jgi:hypothetical protein
MEFSNENVSHFLKGLLELGGGYKVDNTPDLLIRSVANGNKVETINSGDSFKQLAIYGTVAPDVIIINPFAEGEADSTRNTWFYHSRNILLSAVIAKAMIHVLTVAAKSHNSKTEADKNELKTIKFIGKFAIDVDNKLITEFRSIAKNLSDFVKIYYNKSKHCSSLNCCLFSDSCQKQHPNIRVASWEILRGIFLKIMRVKSLDEYKIAPTSADIPVFESFCYVFINVFENLKPVLELVNIPVELDELKGHLKYLDAYHQRAKWCASTSVVQPAVTNAPSKLPSSVQPAAPWIPPTPAANTLPKSVTGGAPMMPQSQPYPVQPVGMMPMGVPAPAPYQGGTLPASVTGGFGSRMY